MVLHSGHHLNTPAALCMMFARKDKRLSSARKRLMSQLGKRKGRTRNIEEHSIQDQQETVSGSQTAFLDTNYQTTSEEIASLGDQNQHGTLLHSDKHPVGVTMEPKVSEPESDSVPPNSDSEYFPRPEKRRRVAILQQPVEAVSLGGGIFVSLFTGISIFRSGQC